MRTQDLFSKLKSTWVMFTIIIITVICIDQASKIITIQYMSEQEILHYPITSFLNIFLVFNYGISFSMLSTIHDDYKKLLIILPLIIIFMIFVWFYGIGIKAKEEQRRKLLAVSLIIGGAVGNIIDRLRIGAVIDFIDFHILNHHYPAFNIADSCIVIGAVILIYQYIQSNAKYI